MSQQLEICSPSLCQQNTGQFQRNVQRVKKTASKPLKLGYKCGFLCGLLYIDNPHWRCNEQRGLSEAGRMLRLFCTDRSGLNRTNLVPHKMLMHHGYSRGPQPPVRGPMPVHGLSWIGPQSETSPLHALPPAQAICACTRATMPARALSRPLCTRTSAGGCPAFSSQSAWLKCLGTAALGR